MSLFIQVIFVELKVLTRHRYIEYSIESRERVREDKDDHHFQKVQALQESVIHLKLLPLPS